MFTLYRLCNGNMYSVSGRQRKGGNGSGCPVIEPARSGLDKHYIMTQTRGVVAVAELADADGCQPSGSKGPCGFESRQRHAVDFWNSLP